MTRKTLLQINPYGFDRNDIFNMTENSGGLKIDYELVKPDSDPLRPDNPTFPAYPTNPPGADDITDDIANIDNPAAEKKDVLLKVGAAAMLLYILTM